MMAINLGHLISKGLNAISNSYPEVLYVGDESTMLVYTSESCTNQIKRSQTVNIASSIARVAV